MFTNLLARSNWIQPPPPNLVPNPDMELDCCWADFSANPTGVAPIVNERSTEFVQEGNYSRKVITNTVPLWSGIISDPYSVIGGEGPWPIYDVTFWIYVPIQIFNFQVTFYDGLGDYHGSWGIGGTPADQWTFVEKTFQSFVAGDQARIAFLSDQNQGFTFYVDNILFTLRP